jgi:ferredoxin-thioredoxin reductase catalytic subunit
MSPRSFLTIHSSRSANQPAAIYRLRESSDRIGVLFNQMRSLICRCCFDTWHFVFHFTARVCRNANDKNISESGHCSCSLYLEKQHVVVSESLRKSIALKHT